MAIEDLVTGALVQEKEEESVIDTMSAAWHEGMNAGSLLHLARRMEKEIQDAEGVEFHRAASTIAGAFLSLGRMGQDRRYLWSPESYSSSLAMLGGEIAARASDYLYSGKDRKRTLAFIHQAIDTHYLVYCIKDINENLGILQDIWGDDTAKRLAELGSVKIPTSRRWLAGSYPASAAEEIRKASAIVYHLRSSLGMSDDEIRVWFDAPLADGKTPFDHVRSRSHIDYRGGKAHKDALTTELERMGIEAFSWAAQMKLPY